jgi:hypothetical protein
MKSLGELGLAKDLARVDLLSQQSLARIFSGARRGTLQRINRNWQVLTFSIFCPETHTVERPFRLPDPI